MAGAADLSARKQNDAHFRHYIAFSSFAVDIQHEGCIFTLEILEMRFVLFLIIGLGLAVSATAQPNLALTATPSASASSMGNFGPANWTDGILNGSFFGWVGTDISFPQPAWMQLEWTQPQTINQMVLHNVGSNFAPPAGNAVVFSGFAQLMYWNGNAWQQLISLLGVPGFGATITLNFPEITTTKLRIDSFNISGSHNPGFDEWEVFRLPADTIDAVLDSIQITSLQGGIGRILRFSMLVKNQGNVPIVNPSVSYSINTNPVSGPFTAIFPGTLQPGTDTLLVHPEVLPAERVLNGRELCAWVSVTGDVQSENDTTCRELSGIGTAVEQSELALFQAYPNPLQSVLYFKGVPAGSTMRFYDAQGRCLAQLDDQVESFEIPLDWPAGLYFLQIQDKNSVRTCRLHRP